MLTLEQFKSLIERVVLVALTWAGTKGYITPEQATEYAPLVIGLAAAFYAWWINRPKALMDAAIASAPKGTVVIPPPEVKK